MAENLVIADTTNKKELYDTLVPQIDALVEGEPDQTANLANIAAALKQTFGFFLGRILPGERYSAGIRSISGTHCLYQNRF